MRKSLFVIPAILLTSSLALAQYTGPNNQSGFTGPTKTATSIQQAKTMYDDTKVTLEGKITEHLGGENYLFSDGKDTIVIEIDHDDWRGVQVAPEDTIIIHGEVDRSRYKGVKIDVDFINKK